MFNPNGQEGVLLPMTDKLRTMLGDLRRDRQLSGKEAGDDASLVKQIVEQAHKELLEGLGYDPNPATAAARVNRVKNASTAAMAGVSEVDKVSAAFGRPPGWMEAQERLHGGGSRR